MNEANLLPEQFKFKHCENNRTIYTATLTPDGRDYIVSWESGSTIYIKTYAEQHVKNKAWIIVEEPVKQIELTLKQIQEFCKDVGLEVAVVTDGFEIYYGNDDPLSVKSEQDLLAAMGAIKTLEEIRAKRG